MGIAIETPRGPVVESLLCGHFKVFSINPKQLDLQRDHSSVAGAKDARLDARVLVESVRLTTLATRTGSVLQRTGTVA